VAKRNRQPDPEDAAREAGLVYVNDGEPGIRRVRSGRGFRYLAPGGAAISDARDLGRIRSLAVPPAWTDVWISAGPRGHIQATGLDARGRKQYRYHPEWRRTRDRTKFDRMIAFGETLPKIRKRIREDIGLPGLPREKVLATILRLIDLTYIRVGSARYAKENGSYGLTTMRGRHVDVNGATIRFEFKGKGGKMNIVDVRDPRVARIVKRCQEIPGQHLFQYLEEDGTRRQISSDDVNAYLREIGGEDFTAKDFRTWAGTTLALRELSTTAAASSAADARRNINAAIEHVAAALRNTVAVCRACYVHPAVIEAYAAGALADVRLRRVRAKDALPDDRLRPEEAALLRFLRRTPERAVA
jgi:DNA topoisomerase-1